jgi:hypothetical protein
MFKQFSIIAFITSLYAFSYVFFKQPFEFYLSYGIFVFYFPFLFARYGVPKRPVYVFIPLFFSGLIYVNMGLNTNMQFYKIFVGFFASVMFYHLVIQAFSFDVKKLYYYYMRSSVIIAAIGLLQIVSFRVGFGPGYDYTWFFNKWGVIPGGLGLRINSVFSEPAYYAAAMAPAFFTAIYNLTVRDSLWISKKQSLLVIAIYLLTYSSLGILGAMLTLLFLLLNMGFVRYGLAIIPILVFGSQWAYVNVPEFRERIDGTNELVETNNIYSYEVHGSSFVLYNNSHVAWENFIRNPLFGTGLGSHETAFDKYSYTNVEGAVQIDFNSKDANSLFLRLMSETGIYGMGLMLYLLIRCWLFAQWSTQREYWVMSNGLVIIIIIYLVRQGHYFYNGFPFFVWLFYYVFEINAAERDEIEKKNTPFEHRAINKNLQIAGWTQQPSNTFGRNTV